MEYEVIVMGGSAGALTMLKSLLPMFPKNFALPIVIVVHLHPH
jgi:two-component system chemotaxis response regulator CheB